MEATPLRDDLRWDPLHIDHRLNGHVPSRKLGVPLLFCPWPHYPFFTLLGVKELGGAFLGERRAAGADGFAVATPRQPFGMDVEKAQAVFA